MNRDIIKHNETKQNNIIINKQIHLHKHNTIMNINHKPIRKQLVKRYNTILIKCLVCGNIKRMTPNNKYCSQQCFITYQDYKHKQFIHSKNKLNEEMKPKKWWEL